MKSEIFLTELEVLAYFTHLVTFPYLNCIEISSQAELLTIFHKLYSDLKEGKMDTLRNFVFEMRPVPVKRPTNELGMKRPVMSPNAGTKSCTCKSVLNDVMLYHGCKRSSLDWHSEKENGRENKGKNEESNRC